MLIRIIHVSLLILWSLQSFEMDGIFSLFKPFNSQQIIIQYAADAVFGTGDSVVNKTAFWNLHSTGGERQTHSL